MDTASLPGLDSLNRQALKALLIAHLTEFESQPSELASRDVELASRNAQLVRLATQLESKKQELVDQGREFLYRNEYIDNLKLQVEKMHRMLFGTKCEKVVTVHCRPSGFAGLSAENSPRQALISWGISSTPLIKTDRFVDIGLWLSVFELPLVRIGSSVAAENQSGYAAWSCKTKSRC